MIHNLTCRAHAIGCAVENIRDMAPEPWHTAEMRDPIITGDGYLADGESCYCDRTPADMAWAAPWILLGLAALDNGRGTMTNLRTKVTAEVQHPSTSIVFVIRDATNGAHLDQYGAPELAHHAARLISQGLTPERARVLTELLCS